MAAACKEINHFLFKYSLKSFKDASLKIISLISESTTTNSQITSLQINQVFIHFSHHGEKYSSVILLKSIQIFKLSDLIYSILSALIFFFTLQ